MGMTIDEAIKIAKERNRIGAYVTMGNSEDEIKFNTENIEALNTGYINLSVFRGYLPLHFS